MTVANLPVTESLIQAPTEIIQESGVHLVTGSSIVSHRPLISPDERYEEKSVDLFLLHVCLL